MNTLRLLAACFMLAILIATAACSADAPSDPLCAFIRSEVDAPYADADYRDGAWHFGDGAITIPSRTEDACWN